MREWRKLQFNTDHDDRYGRMKNDIMLLSASCMIFYCLVLWARDTILVEVAMVQRDVAALRNEVRPAEPSTMLPLRSRPVRDAIASLDFSGSSEVLQKCQPNVVDTRKLNYGYSGIHRIAGLKAWFVEVPKSGSTSMSRLFKLRQGSITYGSGPRPGDISFAVVRQPACRAISGFKTAYVRSRGRTNDSHSPCPFQQFPYLLDNSTSFDTRMQIALATLSTHGTALASAACGYAYHHMMPQTYFLWPLRMHAIFDTEEGRPPPVTVLLRLESLHEDFARFCAARNASDFCSDQLARIGGKLPTSNEALLHGGALSSLTPRTLKAINTYYHNDFGCLRYTLGDRSLKCSSEGDL